MASPASIQSNPIEQRTNGVRLRVLRWSGVAERLPFLLLDGLASNERFWEPVAARSAAAQ